MRSVYQQLVDLKSASDTREGDYITYLEIHTCPHVCVHDTGRVGTGRVRTSRVRTSSLVSCWIRFNASKFTATDSDGHVGLKSKNSKTTRQLKTVFAPIGQQNVVEDETVQNRLCFCSHVVVRSESFIQQTHINIK